MQAVYTRLGIVLTYTVMRMRDDVDAKRRRAREVDVCAVESDKVGTSTPNGDVHARLTPVQWRVTKSERRRHWHVDVTTQMSTYSARTSTLEREVDVCARTNFVTNGLPYARTAASVLHTQTCSRNLLLRYRTLSKDLHQS